MADYDRDVHWVTEPRAIECVASTVRAGLMDRLEAEGPATARELAAWLGMPPDRVYYHLRQLQSVGLVVERGKRPGRRRAEAEFALAAARWHIRYEPLSPRKAKALDKLTRVMLRQAGRDFAAGLPAQPICGHGPERNLWSLRLESRLGAGDLARINHHLQAILAILRRPRAPRGGGRLHALTWVLAPLEDGEQPAD